MARAGRVRDMVVRRVVGGVVLLAIGAGAGAAAATLMPATPQDLRVVAPVPASSPSYPAGTVEVLTDPAAAPLATGLSTHPERLGSPDFGVRLPVPDGWGRTDTDEVEAKWFVPDGPINTYLLRAKLITSQRVSVQQATTARIAALRGVVDDLDVEEQNGDSFVATYVAESYRRLTMERFLDLGTRQVTIAVIGRLEDREGLTALLDQVVAGTMTPP